MQAAWARDYEARKAVGRLTPAELDVLPWDEALEEIERERPGTPQRDIDLVRTRLQQAEAYYQVWLREHSERTEQGE